MRPCAFLLLGLLLTGCQENFDERCQREAKEYTRKYCPRTLEPFNTLDSTTYDIPSRTYRYWYTLSGEYDTPQAIEAMRQGKTKLHAQLKNALTTSVELKKCKEEGIDFAYIYRSASSGKTILEVRLTKEDYR